MIPNRNECECNESRKKQSVDTWLNPKYHNNTQSAAKLRTGERSTTISKESRETEAEGILMG